MPLAPHSASPSGFEGVLKVRDGCFQARVNIKGKSRCTVWTSATADLQRRQRGSCRNGGLCHVAFQARARSALTRERWSALAPVSPPASDRSQPSSIARRRDEEEGGMELMIAQELQRVEERRVKQCVSADRCLLSPVKKQE